MSFARYITDDNTVTGNVVEVFFTGWRKGALTSRDCKTLLEAETFAASITAFTGQLHIGVDRGPYISPRYDVVEPPRVGEPVSYAFNGDYYPDGVVTHVTKGTFRIVKTDTGSVYYRHKKSGAWIKKGGTWSLVKGHIKRFNREF